MNTVITKNTSDLEQLLEKAQSLPDLGGGVAINNQDKTITENGSYSADNGYTGLGVVTVEVPERVVTEKGEDGFSPIATVEQTDDGAVISITDKNGMTTATITNGKTAYQYAQEVGYTGTENEFASRMAQPIPDKLADLQEDITHRTVTDKEKADWDAKSDFSGKYEDLEGLPTIPSIENLATTGYVDDAVKNKVDKDGSKVLSTNDYTTAEKNKLANIAAGAEVNVNADWNATSGDAQILNKPTLGSMAAKSSVAKSDLASGVQTSLDKADSALQPGDISDWAKQPSKPSYTKTEVGLGNVDNTSDANKPVSTAQANAIAEAKKAGTDAQSNLTTHTNNKSNPHSVTKAQVGLGNVDNVKQYSAENPPVVAQDTAPTDTSVIWVDTDDNTVDEFQDAVNTALAQAKASGEFDGSDANVTATNIASALGYTPAKQSDVDQKANKQGLSLGVGSDGLVYLFVDGSAQGNGLDIKAEAVAGDVVGYVNENNTIILTGALADGTYILKYEDEEGKTIDIGNLSIGNVSNIKNWLRESYESVDSTAIYNEIGYKVGYRLRSNSEEQILSVTTATNPVFITGFIPVTSGQTVYLKDCYFDTRGINGNPSSDESKNYYGEACGSINILLCNAQGATQNAVSWLNVISSGYFTLTPDANGHVTRFTVNREGVAFIRLGLAGDPANAIITVDHPIV